jgi:hypothetical protein
MTYPSLMPRLEREFDDFVLHGLFFVIDNRSNQGINFCLSEVTYFVCLSFCICFRTLTLGKYLGRGEKVLLVLIRQFSCLLCRIHLKDLEAHKVSHVLTVVSKVYDTPS